MAINDVNNYGNISNGNPSSPFSANRSLIVMGMVFIIGVVVGLLTSSFLPSSFGNYKKGYAAGFNTAKKLVETSSMGVTLRAPEDIRTLTGVITAVRGNSITLHSSTVNPFDNVELIDRTILINSSTTIVKLAQKDVTSFQAEMKAYLKELQSASSTSSNKQPPSPFTQTVGDTTSIKVGTAINVVAFDNIKTVKEFTAKEIQIQPQTTR